MGCYCSVLTQQQRKPRFRAGQDGGAGHNILWLVDGTTVDETATRDQWSAETHAPSSLRLARNLGAGWAVGLSHIWDLTALV